MSCPKLLQFLERTIDILGFFFYLMTICATQILRNVALSEQGYSFRLSEIGVEIFQQDRRIFLIVCESF